MAIQTTEVYDKMDSKYGEKMEHIFGPTLLAYPEDSDSSRLNMLSSNLKQIIPIQNPDIAHILTGYENIFGKLNKSYKKINGEWVVKDKIWKFRDPLGNPIKSSIYLLVLYNKKTNTYDFIEKKIAEDLTEKFGYLYNTDKMDAIPVGAKIKDEILYASTSYDKNMNYRIGKNALVMYTTHNETLEDAIKIRKGWADQVKSFEVDTVKVMINSNDIMLNLYGDKNNYKPFPDIGESIKESRICAVRRINYDHILYDFQSDNLTHVCATDVSYRVQKKSIIYDMNIFYNGEEVFPENIFFDQLRGYHNNIREYADKICEWGKIIKSSGSNFTQNVSYIYSRYKNYNNPEYKWKDKKVFDNILIEFKTTSIIDIHPGFKMVGRYGDKGIISRISECNSIEMTDDAYQSRRNIVKSLLDSQEIDMTDEEIFDMASRVAIVDDCEMPYLEDGTPIDICLNSSGAIRRLNTGQLVEVELNFIAENIRKYIKKYAMTIDEKFKIFYDLLNTLNAEQGEFYLKLFNSFTQEINVDKHTLVCCNRQAREEFIYNVEEYGFYIEKPPHSEIRYTKICELYKMYPWIKPYTGYINRFGITHKIMRPVVAGSKYMLLLKQTSNKNFSARSTGRIDKKGLPAKSNDKKNNLSVTSNSPIKIGEAHNMLAAISGRDLAEYNIFMRSSPIGRKSLKRIIEASGNPLEIKKMKVKNTYNNVNADIGNAYLKGIGIKLNFITNHGYPLTKEQFENEIVDYPISGNQTLIDTRSNINKYLYLLKMYNSLRASKDCKDLSQMDIFKSIWDDIENDPDVRFLEIPENIIDSCKNAIMRDIDFTEIHDPEENKEDNCGEAYTHTLELITESKEVS